MIYSRVLIETAMWLLCAASVVTIVIQTVFVVRDYRERKIRSLKDLIGDDNVLIRDIRNRDEHIRLLEGTIKQMDRRMKKVERSLEYVVEEPYIMGMSRERIRELNEGIILRELALEIKRRGFVDFKETIDGNKATLRARMYVGVPWEKEGDGSE